MALDLVRKSEKEKTASEIGVVSGIVMSYAGTTAPAGWLECDGSAISRTTYADLFANISTKYGIGDGSTTFNLPNGPRRTVEVDLDFTSSQGTGSNRQAKGFAYQDSLGNWWLRGNAFATSLSGATTPNVSIAGTDLLGFHAVVIRSAQNIVSDARADENTNAIEITHSASQTILDVTFDVPLNAEPTDAFVGADSRFSTFAEALESIPIIKI